MSDSRRWPRLRLTLEVSLRFADLAGLVSGRTTNISREGLFICMDRPKPIGTSVRIQLQVAKPKHTFLLEGVVVRTVPDPDEPPPRHKVESGVGVFLTHASAGWARFIEGQVAHRQPRGRQEVSAKVTIQERVRFIKGADER